MGWEVTANGGDARRQRHEALLFASSVLVVALSRWQSGGKLMAGRSLVDIAGVERRMNQISVTLCET